MDIPSHLLRLSSSIRDCVYSNLARAMPKMVKIFSMDNRSKQQMPIGFMS